MLGQRQGMRAAKHADQCCTCRAVDTTVSAHVYAAGKWWTYTISA
jgi:hypothetical protein